MLLTTHCVATLRVCRSYGSSLRGLPSVPAPSPRHWKTRCRGTYRELHSWRLSGCGGEREKASSVVRGRFAGRSGRGRSLTATAAVCTPEEFSVTCKIGGSEIQFSSGKVALLADGAVMVQSGNTCILVTAVSSKQPSPPERITPLQVEYRGLAAAAGRIPNNFFRRDLRRLSDREVLVCRFIDRSLRPFYPNRYYDTQVSCTMLAVDGRNDPDVMSLNGASAALCLSEIPWNGPVAAVRVGLIDGKLCLNPTMRELGSSTLDLIVASTETNIVMVEGQAHEVPEDTFCEAVLFAQQEAQPLLATLSELKKERGKPPRRVNLQLPSPEIQDFISSECRDGIRSLLTDSTHKKLSGDKDLRDLLASALQKLSLQQAAGPSLSVQELHNLALDSGLRCDGRGLDDLRPISCEVDLLPKLHGSSLFKRGETQVFCTVTFDSLKLAAQNDQVAVSLGAEKYKPFMLHYESPPFSRNEIGDFLVPSRREIGHGVLAEKAFLPVLPAQFPFTTRVTAHVLDSKGSSSMATVCGASLALYDAGVPLSRPVAGVACGLVTNQDPDTGELLDYKILTDITGREDAQGNMDLKVAGTSEGITSLQLDVKSIRGIPYRVFEEAVKKSRAARLEVLDVMSQCQATPRPELKENGPAYASLEVPPEKRRKLIGSGGHRIRALMAETGAEVRNVTEEQLSVFAPTRESMKELMEWVETFLQEEEVKEEFEVGAIYQAIVRDVRDYGLIVEMAPGVTILLHKSQISLKKITHPSELQLEVGQTISVRYYGRDPVTKKHFISRKALEGPPPREGSEAMLQKLKDF